MDGSRGAGKDIDALQRELMAALITAMVRRPTHEQMAHMDDLHADSDDVSHRFRSKPAIYSDRSQPGIPMIPAG